MSGSRSSKRRRRALPTLAVLLALLALGLIFRSPLEAWFRPEPHAAQPDTRAPAAGADHGPETVDHYTCSMHPSVQQPGPGKCPICGMDLTPVTKAQQAQGVVWIDEARRQLSGVRTANVTEAPLQRTLRAVGRVSYDESKLSDVTLKVPASRSR